MKSVHDSSPTAVGKLAALKAVQRNQVQGALAARSQVPAPDPQALAHSERLLAVIREAIDAGQGKISFAEYMSLALMAPGLGYYSAGSRKFGSAGDFVTAPEISPLFGYSLARQCQQVLNALRRAPDLQGKGAADILEVGAGTGAMAVDILQALEAQGTLPAHYFILEPSPELRQRQGERIKRLLPGALATRVQWLTALPTDFRGIILANEVLDVLPVHRFKRVAGGLQAARFQEAYVKWDGQQLQWRWDELSSQELAEQLCLRCSHLAEGYQSEINLAQDAWLAGLSACLHSGLILMIDYGYPRHEYYHPQRHMGTLLCHYRHRAHEDALFYPGLQDITAQVDFTAVAEAASGLGLHVAGFNSQGQFLLSCGIHDITAEMSQHADMPQRLRLSQQLKQLTMPGEMGEIFKVMAVSRELDMPLLGFSLFDLRSRL